MKKLISLAILLLFSASGVSALVVIETATGVSTTHEGAAMIAIEKAKHTALLKQPSFVYVHTSMDNDKAQYEVIKIPAQIKGMELIDSKKWVSKDGLYMARISLKFEITPASDVDRINFMDEHLAMKKMISTGNYQRDRLAIDDKQASIVAQFRESKVTAQKAAEHLLIGEEVRQFKANFLPALANTYEKESVAMARCSYPDRFDLAGGFYDAKNAGSNKVCYELIVKLKNNCRHASSGMRSEVGTLCDLYRNLPSAIEHTIAQEGLFNGIEAKGSHTTENMIVDPLRTLRVMPVTNSADRVPLRYGYAVDRYLRTKTFKNQALMDNYVGEKAVSVVPMFIATAIIDKPSVYATIMAKSTKQYIDVPLTSDRYLLGDTFRVLLTEGDMDFSKGMFLSAALSYGDEFDVVVWWAGSQKHPAPNGWHQADGSLHFPDLPKVLDSSSFLSYATWLRARIRDGDDVYVSDTLKYQNPIKYLQCVSSMKVSADRDCHTKTGPLITLAAAGGEINNARIAKRLPASNLFEERGPNNPMLPLNEKCYTYNRITGRLVGCKSIVSEPWGAGMGRESVGDIRSRSLFDDIQNNEITTKGDHWWTTKFNSKGDVSW